MRRDALGRASTSSKQRLVDVKEGRYRRRTEPRGCARRACKGGPLRRFTTEHQSGTSAKIGSQHAPSHSKGDRDQIWFGSLTKSTDPNFGYELTVGKNRAEATLKAKKFRHSSARRRDSCLFRQAQPSLHCLNPGSDPWLAFQGTFDCDHHLCTLLHSAPTKPHTTVVATSNMSDTAPQTKNKFVTELNPKGIKP